MKKPMKELTLGFATALPQTQEAHAGVRPAQSKIETFALTQQQTAVYGNLTEANGFSMEAALQRLEASKARKAAS